jgi:dihydroflavonol-4-reductase
MKPTGPDAHFSRKERGMNAFVTGATGLLGNNLVRALRADGHAVRALARSQKKAQRLLGDTGAEVVVGDMEDVPAFSQALAGCDVVFHTAAYFREYYEGTGDHVAKLDTINVKATVELADRARASGARRLVFTNSAGIIGLRPDGSAGDEETPPAAIARENLYFHSKLVGSQRLRAFCPKVGLELVEVLPGWMFGPWDAAPTGAGRLVLDFLAGKLPAIPPGGTCVVDARDVAAGMVSAAERGRSGEKYLLAGPFTTLEQVITTLSQVTGVPAPRTRLPYAVAWAYAALTQTWARIKNSPSLVSLTAVRMMHARLDATSAKAERELGWRHRPLAETLRDVVAWYRAQGISRERVARGEPVTA